ncbi:MULTISPECIES: 4-hydroxyphenylacetate 3-monooxygenase, reductase component [Pseudomonas]|uniref:4-hydroxyphenylacetate 3-monooxygenase reductase component n=1 Tax=Pseudomonas delhiensis TaxID=366289 RepID=A0A239MMT5_9PSED|nr:MULTISPECIES: 4-hydroxyphenylacetate 3-monooxygenase, reductase component [Pseudomonas]MED5609159.1 4-hydroxyphenylacetate 3-monooxygenase, reductase component [Pseudomonas sp. JH-2]PWU27682.1 4-hydroxyphenylacetate 3-monooxygenase, reductase component [Pseudomonas sp. RW407]SDI20178.1 4-hydroxyphenylacetate 3-monooxygenase reductase component [Pseudomonas delhiensis]SNT43404.1 4-hydroxyphenylacetate 3-monooxygenase reductase component [Pseudomonas delhiensis]
MNNLSQTQIDFRNAMARLPAAVNIITSDGPGGRCGITASAVCSVTDSPPTLLVCINRGSASHEPFRANGHLCVNVLRGEQEELARHFAGMTRVPMEERFASALWEDGVAGVPVLRDALVTLEGRISECKEVGSHSVLFVELERAAVREQGDSLVYFNRLFHRLDGVSAAA